MKVLEEYAKAIPEKYDFDSRVDGYRRPVAAGDKVNVMLNYGYSLLEAECLRAINTTGLYAHIGFLHEMNPNKYSLDYDLQELFRFLVEFTVLNLIETDSIDKQDFIRTENYGLRVKPSGARKLTSEFNVMLNRGFKV
jgi:CRISPR-associated protein Cas1